MDDSLEPPAPSYAQLRREGVAHLERLAGEVWTDFNAHDPGITILEQLCYAITDLGYRISHPLPDLLAGPEDPYASLYSPATILTTEPVTRTDLRKLVLDVQGVRNAWIEVVDAPEPALAYDSGTQALHLQGAVTTAMTERDRAPVAIQGLCRVQVELSDLLDIDGTTVKQEVARRLHAHRPLCEDFVEIRILEPQDIRVDTRVEIAPGQDAESVLVAIYAAISGYVAPVARFGTLGELVARGTPLDEIFDGPRLDHGFLDDDALAAMERRQSLHTSDLIHAIMDVPGVRAVRDITLSKGVKDEPWSLELDPKRAPRLDLLGSTITLMRGGLAIGVNPKRAIDSHVAQARSRDAVRVLSDAERDLIPPRGRDRSLAAHASIQHHMPACYGIGASGLPDSAPRARRARAKQLEAYLLVFDQLLANAFAQLGHAQRLLSFTGERAPTYVAGMLDDPTLQLEAVRKGDEGEHQAILEAITASTPKSGEQGDRENRFLDHLLARFGEDFAEYALVLAGVLGEQASDKLAQDKRRFLQDYPRVSRARNTGFDYTQLGGAGNTSGLEDRLTRTLGLVAEDGERFLVIEHVLLRPIAPDAGQASVEDTYAVPLLAASPRADPFSMQLSIVLPQTTARFGLADFREFVDQTIRAETPAHLTVYVHWLPAGDFALLEDEVVQWREHHREYWAQALGV